MAIEICCEDLKFLQEVWVNKQLDAQLRFIKHFFYYYNPLHVSGNSVLIIRRSNCVNTISGIVLSVSDLRCAHRRSLTDSTIPDAVLIQFDLLMMRTLLLETCRRL